MGATFLYVQMRGEMNTHNNNNNPDTTSIMGSRRLVRQALYLKSLVLRPFVLCLFALMPLTSLHHFLIDSLQVSV